MEALTPEEALELAEIYRNDPVLFCKEVLGINLWEKQVEIIESVRDNDNTAVASGHGVGKTFIAGCTGLWFLSTHDQSRVITTAPTNRQVESILWAEIWNLYKNAKVPLGGRLLKTSLSFEEKHFMLGLSTDDPDRFQGHHAENLLLIMDEAPGVDPRIYEAAQGILTSKGARSLLIGNPTASSGPFFDCFKNKLWKTFHISCYDSPAIRDPEAFPTLTTQKWIDERKEQWGENSPMFQSRVKGEFPLEGEDTLIPLNWCERAVQRWHKNRDVKRLNTHIFLGLDVARYGTNKTVLTDYLPPRVREIKRVQQKSTTVAVNLVIQAGITAGAKLQQVTVDDTGVGGGVTDRLRDLKYPVIPINFSQKPADPMHFRSIRDEIYWYLREMFRSDDIEIPPDEDLIAQLSAIKYKINARNGRIEIETKDDMKKRGVASPDEADSVAIAVYGARRHSGTVVFRKQTPVNRENSLTDMVYY